VRLLAAEELVADAREFVADTRELPMAAAARDAGADARAHDDDADASTDIQTILFTSGTTGRPRMVPLTFANHRASVRASAANLGVRPGDRWLCVLPLFHAGGLAILHRSRHDGSAVELHGRFDAAACARALRGGVTLASFVPTMLARVLEADPALDAAAVPMLRAVLLGGAAADASLWAEIVRRGLPVLGTWGMTETASQAVTVHPADALRKPGAAGRVLSGMELQVVGPDGRECAPGEEGALQVRGAMLTPGWLDDDAAWHARMHDGWFDTGDVGALDDEGVLWVGARREDLIITGGENVAPPEVEAVLAAHPAVAAACVAGVRDPEWGQVVGAAVVLRSSVSTDELEAHCRAQLAGYKVPRRWLVLEALPMTASGKVSRAMVRGMMEGSEKKNAEDAEGTEQG
jgi:o-succinylbenzoate---CoA ligase